MVATGYLPHAQPTINNGVPDSTLEELDRRFTGWATRDMAFASAGG